MIGCGQGAGDGRVGAVRILLGQKAVDGFVKTALEQMLVAVKGDVSLAGEIRFGWQMKAMQRVEEKECPHPFVEICILPPHPVQGRAFVQQFGQ